jgi:hypothetical protein
MYKRNTYPVNNQRSVPYCPPLASPGPGGIPESSRITTEQCGIAWVQTVTTNPCNPQPVVISTIVTPGAPMPLVNVTSTPASATIQKQKQIIANNVSDPYNPDTRFAQYFPAPPLPYVCPVRLPSNEPPASLQTCQPIRRFQGSTVTPSQ